MGFSKIFRIGVICPKNLKIERGQTGNLHTPAYIQGMHCKETLFTTRCNPRAREFPRSG